MALDLDILGAKLGPFLHRWDSKDALLYALSVGAGPSELAFTTENTRGITQKVLPTFSVIGCGPEAMDIWDKIGSFDHSQLLHLEQRISLSVDLPPSAEVETTASVEGIYDRIIGASVEVKFTTRNVSTAEVLFETESTVIIRGEGGFGGPRGPRAKVANAPERDPDAVITYETQLGQALLYRLNGVPPMSALANPSRSRRLPRTPAAAPLIPALGHNSPLRTAVSIPATSKRTSNI